MNENINDNEVLENDNSESAVVDYTDILEHISDSIDTLVFSSSSEVLEDSSTPVHTIDDLYSVGAGILLILLVLLVLKIFHNIVSNISRL